MKKISVTEWISPLSWEFILLTVAIIISYIGIKLKKNMFIIFQKQGLSRALKGWSWRLLMKTKNS